MCSLTLPPSVCPPVYCPFPGYLADGRVLLVGNMGMYIYRPYVRKVGGPLARVACLNMVHVTQAVISLIFYSITPMPPRLLY